VRPAALLAVALALAACAGPRPEAAPPPGLTGRLPGHRHSVMSLALSADGRWLVSGSRDGTLRVWNALTVTREAVLSPGWWRPAMWAVAISPDGALAAGGSDDFVVRVWDVRQRALRARLEGHEQSIRVLAFSPDGALLASGGRDTTVRLWETATWRLLRTLPHGNTVRALAFTPDGARVFTGTADDVIHAWDVATGAPVGLLRGHGNTVQALAVSPDGRTLISGGADRTLRLWSLGPPRRPAVLELDRSDEPPSRWELYGIHPGPEVMALALAPDGRVVASGHRDSAIRLWSLPEGVEVARLPSPAATTYAVAFSRDGRYLYSGGDDDVIYRWDVGRLGSAAR
jgi:WD40 repeat protein